MSLLQENRTATVDDWVAGRAVVGNSAAAVDSFDRRVLVAAVLGRNRAWLAAHGDYLPTADEAAALAAALARRAAGEPVAYIVGEREFYGMPLKTTPAALIPRPETELLVDLALERLPAAQPARVLDLGTGTGAIALALARERPQAQVLAVDVAADTLALATENRERLGLHNVELQQSDWFAALAARRFDLIVSNPPYVAAGDPHLSEGDLPFEPRGALTPGGDGLDALRIIAREATRFIRPGGWLLVEHGYDQLEACQALFTESGWAGVETRRDLAGQPRVTLGYLPRGR